MRRPSEAVELLHRVVQLLLLHLLLYEALLPLLLLQSVCHVEATGTKVAEAAGTRQQARRASEAVCNVALRQIGGGVEALRPQIGGQVAHRALGSGVRLCLDEALARAAERTSACGCGLVGLLLHRRSPSDVRHRPVDDLLLVGVLVERHARGDSRDVPELVDRVLGSTTSAHHGVRGLCVSVTALPTL